ncbi:MAG: response regulator [Acidobacteriota bacterium]
MERASARKALSVVTGRLTRYTVAWTIIVAAASAWLIHDQLDRHRDNQIKAGEFRLSSLRESLGVTFQHLSALPRALGRQANLTSFLSHMRMEGASTLSEADRARLTQTLARRDDVQAISHTLHETSRDFQVTQVYATDPYGTIVADSLIHTPVSNLGANRRTRQYFTDALETGSGTQFLVGRINKVPGFYFSARMGDQNQPTGVVVVRQDPQALMRLFGDLRRHLFVTDAQGVILMSNQSGELLSRIHAPTSQSMNDAGYLNLYQRVPPQLGWQIHTVTVRGEPTMVVAKGGQRYLALSSPLDYGGLTVWALIPMEGETAVMAAWGAGMLLVLFMGYAFLGFRSQRAQRIHDLTVAREELHDLAHALPLTVFRYHQPAQGRGHFSFIGGGLETVLGITPSELEQDPDWAWRMAQQQPPVPPTQAVEFALQRRDRPAWVRCECLAISHADGSTTYNGYWSDITERKNVEARSQAVFQHAPFAFLFFDETQSVTRCNPAALTMFGARDEQDLVGLKPMRPPLSPNPDPGDSALADKVRQIHQHVEARQVFQFEWQHTRLDGTPFDTDIVAIPFVHDGKQQVCAIIQDITVRKQAEVATLAAQQAAEAAALAKSRFLANMSHEIRTPMNAVLGMTHLALMDELPARARNYIDKAHRAAGNLLQILNDVLDVSKIESGKLELENTEFQLESVISNMADVLGVKAEEKDLELLFTAPPDIPTALIGDPTRLGQILINLGNNAIKFTSQGEIVIGCEVDQMSAQDVTLHFWVRDTGIGMSPDQLDRLFQPFTQGDNSTTRQFGGTGLGLTISRQLVEFMHGRIWVDSQPGRGSTFHFTARFGVQQQANNRRALLANEMEGKRVLLVDDNPTAREVLGDMARRLGLNVEVAASGEQALALMELAQQARQPHHVLLTDWKMPGMDGIAFARRALAMPPEQRPCVLLVTAFAREEAIKAAEGVGLAGVITKPVTPSTLLDSLAHSLGQELAPAPTVRNANKILQKAQRHLAGARVLLVEDQPLNQELACDLLERAGLTVVTASDGTQALERLRHDGPFDGVLMDCQMPIMDGYTAAQRIREEPQWAALPIIAMTASAMAADRERVLQSGMNDHITKPLDLTQMFSIMARWIIPAKPAARPEALSDPTARIPLTAALDTTDGLARCMGNLDLYRRLVKGFAKTQQDFGQRFSEAGDDLDQALHLTHTLKGLAGNIGAKKLLTVANDLEQALHNGQDHQAALQQVLTELPLVLADIAQLLQTHSAAPAAPFTVDLAQDPDLRPYWDRLAQLIEDNEAQALDVLQEVLQRWPEIHQAAAIQQLKRALDQYDFEVAAAVLLDL